MIYESSDLSDRDESPFDGKSLGSDLPIAFFGGKSIEDVFDRKLSYVEKLSDRETT